MINELSTKKVPQKKEEDFQFLIDNYLNFNQQKAVELWFERVEQSPHEPAKFFPNQNSNTYYIQLNAILRGLRIKRKKTIIDHFKNLYLVSAKENLNYSIEDLKNCVENYIPSTKPIDRPMKSKKIDKSKIINIDDKKDNLDGTNNDEIENEITFEEIWDEIGDLSFGNDLLEEIQKNLISRVHQNVSDDILPFLKDGVGDPRLEFIKKNHRIFQTEFDTDEINDIETVNLIAELSSILDRKAEMIINENGILKKLIFQTSDERIRCKIRGFEIVKKLRKNGIKISLFNDIMSNINFNSDIQKPSAQNMPNLMTIITNINIQTFFTITFGRKQFLSPASSNLNTTINEHAKKIAGLIEVQTSWGRPVK